MTRIKQLRGECQHCGGSVEFIADRIGLMAECPHCRAQTELLLPALPDEPMVPRKVVVWTAVSVVILGLGFVGSVMALKRAQRLAAGQRRPAATNSIPRGEPGSQPSETPR